MLIKHFVPDEWQNGDGYGEVEEKDGEEVVILDREVGAAVPVSESVVICSDKSEAR